MHLMNSSVNALCREGKTYEAIEAVKEMERRGIMGSFGLYYYFACYLCSAGRLQEVLTQDMEVNLIITDYCMPGMTGYDLLRKIKESENLKDIPVVIMSSENIPSRINRLANLSFAKAFLHMTHRHCGYQVYTIIYKLVGME
ncbi:hypothetical protein Ancab_034270 [Ancistrocladus abbreviatus]